MMKTFFDCYVDFFKESFEEFGEMQKTVNKFQQLLDKKKKNMFLQFKQAESVNKSVPWMCSNFSIPLNIAFENAKQRQEILKSSTKTSVFKTVGNLPTIVNQLGLENAWVLIKNKGNEECESSDKVEEEEKMEVIESENDEDEKYKDASKLLLEHVNRKRADNPDYVVSSVTSLDMLGPTIRDHIKKAGGLNAVKTYMRMTSGEWDSVIGTEKGKKRKSTYK